jgi:hypothetical protein
MNILAPVGAVNYQISFDLVSLTIFQNDAFYGTY